VEQLMLSLSSLSDVDIDFYKAFKKIQAERGWNEETMGGWAAPSSLDPKTKTRSFAVTGYLGSKVQGRKNLRVVTEALVQRVILKKEDGNVAAVGGQFLLPSGEPTTIKVNKEVILCAGAFHSPTTLELSGIGNPELLQKYGIDVIVANPNVGENLQDHAMCAISFEADSVKTADAMVRDPSIMPALLDMYQKDRSGPLGANFHVVAYTPSSLFDSSASDDLATILGASPKDPDMSTVYTGANRGGSRYLLKNKNSINR
jgi:choline dehydrogenase-like flavoprotein